VPWSAREAYRFFIVASKASSKQNSEQITERKTENSMQLVHRSFHNAPSE
jgi:HPt (histidine-containing phosphotransfer) domain-containing protein